MIGMFGNTGLGSFPFELRAMRSGGKKPKKKRKKETLVESESDMESHTSLSETDETETYQQPFSSINAPYVEQLMPFEELKRSEGWQNFIKSTDLNACIADKPPRQSPKLSFKECEADLVGSIEDLTPDIIELLKERTRDSAKSFKSRCGDRDYSSQTLRQLEEGAIDQLIIDAKKKARSNNRNK